MKPTIFVILLPVIILVWDYLGTASNHTFNNSLFALWMSSALFCLGWGFYISQKSRFLGWLCIGAVLIQFVLVLLPVFDRVKNHAQHPFK